MNRLLVIGLDEPEQRALRERLTGPVLFSELVPRLRLWEGRLEVESERSGGRFVPVAGVVFHSIFENDLPVLSALAL
jgi:hypothetical protein